jgi:hypothetical protein
MTDYNKIMSDLQKKQEWRDVVFTEDDLVKQANKQSDMVNSPAHYNQSGIECIDAIEAALGPDGFKYYLQGNIMKYLWRYRYKNGTEDLKKAQWYTNKLIERETDG